MDYIQEVSSYSDDVFLIKLDTLVRGYDGETIGPANQQAQALANRTKWLRDNLESLNTNVKKQILDLIETESNDIESLTKKLKEYTDTLETEIQTNVNSLKEKITEVESALNDNLNDAITEVNKNTDNKIGEVNQTVDDLKLNYDKEIAALEKTTSTLTSNVSTLTENQKKLAENTAATDANLAELKNEVALKNELGTVFGETLTDGKDINLSPGLLGGLIKGGTGINVNIKEDRLEITNGEPNDTAWSLKTFNNVKAGDFFFYTVPTNYFSDYMIHNFYRYFDNGQYKEKVTRTYAGSVLDNLIKNETLYSDDKGRIICDVKYTANIKDQQTDNSYSASLALSQPPVDLEEIRIVADMDTTATKITTLTSNKDYANYNYKLFSVSVYPNFETWNLFAAPIAKSSLSDVPPYVYWSGLNLFNSYKTDIYVGIVLDQPIYIQAYKLQRMNKFRLATSTLAKSWRFEASTSDDPTNATWVVLDTQTNADISFKEGDDEFKIFKLDGTEGIYRSFRIVITDVFDKAQRPCLSRLNLIPAHPLLLKDNENANSFYTVNESGELVEKTNTANESLNSFIYNNAFYDTPHIKLTDVKEINKYSLLSDAQASASIYCYGKKIQLRLDKNIEEDRYAVLCVKQIGPIIPESNDYNVKMALVTSENKWYGHDSSGWVELTSISNETSYDKIASILYEKGIGLDEFNSITEESFGDFIACLTGNDTTFSIAYATYNKLVSDPVVPKSIDISYGNELGWEPVDKDNIKIKFLNKRMVVEIVKDGTYKLLYSFLDKDL